MRVTKGYKLSYLSQRKDKTKMVSNEKKVTGLSNSGRKILNPSNYDLSSGPSNWFFFHYSSRRNSYSTLPWTGFFYITTDAAETHK